MLTLDSYLWNCLTTLTISLHYPTTVAVTHVAAVLTPYSVRFKSHVYFKIKGSHESNVCVVD